MAANCGTLTPAVKFNGGTRRLRLPGCHLKPGLKLIDAIETLTRTRRRCGWGGNPVWWQLQNCIINHTRIKMSTEMKRWVANMLRRERKRKRGRGVGEGHAHLHPFGLWSTATAAAQCTAIGMGFGEGTLTGIWLELLSLLACNVEHLQTNQICIRISFILFCTLLCAAAPLCASVCLCVCMCVCCEASRVASARCKSEIVFVFVFASCKIRNNQWNAKRVFSTLLWPAKRRDFHAAYAKIKYLYLDLDC